LQSVVSASRFEVAATFNYKDIPRLSQLQLTSPTLRRDVPVTPAAGGSHRWEKWLALSDIINTSLLPRQGERSRGAKRAVAIAAIAAERLKSSLASLAANERTSSRENQQGKSRVRVLLTACFSDFPRKNKARPYPAACANVRELSCDAARAKWKRGEMGPPGNSVLLKRQPRAIHLILSREFP